MKQLLILISIHLLYSPLFFSILIIITLACCTKTEEALEAEQEIQANKNVALEAEQEIQADKKVILNQEIDGEDTSVSTNEETEGEKEHSPLIGQSEETCYVDADATKSEFDPTLLSNISISLSLTKACQCLASCIFFISLF